MNVTYTDKVKQPAEAFGLLQKATAELEKITGASGSEVLATWDRDDNHHQYVLRLSDWSGQVSDRFDASKLWSPRDMRWSLRSLWGDLLQIRSHKLMDKLIGAGEPGEN